MRSQALSAGVLLLVLLSSSAFGQSYDMIIHLSGGGTVTIPHDDIRRIEFANIPTGVQEPEDPGHALGVFQLLQNYPNPFNPSTTIAYDIPDVADVTVRIYNLQGALIKELLHETQPAGRHQLTWDGTDSERAQVSSGVYFCAVECGERVLAQKLILVK